VRLISFWASGDSIHSVIVVVGPNRSSSLEGWFEVAEAIQKRVHSKIEFGYGSYGIISQVKCLKCLK
jgi:hypothetical protein